MTDIRWYNIPNRYYPSTFNGDNFTLFESGELNKFLQFDLSQISPGARRILSSPNKSGVLALVGDIADSVDAHELTYNHGLISTALQSESDPLFTNWLATTPPLYSELDPVFEAWLLATPPLYSESDPIFSNWLSTTPPLYAEVDTLQSVTSRGEITTNPIETGGVTSPWIKLENNGVNNALEVYDSSDIKTFEIRENGHYRSTGNAWKDMISDLFGKRLNSVAGAVAYDYDENAVIFKANGDITDANDRVSGNQEINHEMLVGTDTVFRPHLHWWQQVTTGAVVSHVWTGRWRLQRNGQAKATAWNTITANANTAKDVFDFTGEVDGLYNQLTRFDEIVVTCGISDTLQFQLTRSDANVGNIPVTFFDIHGRVDSDGSDNLFSKT